MTLFLVQDDAALTSVLSRHRSVAAHVSGTLYRTPAGNPAYELEGSTRLPGLVVFDVDARLIEMIGRMSGTDEGWAQPAKVVAVIGLRSELCQAFTLPSGRRKACKKIDDGVFRRFHRRGIRWS